LFSFCSPLAAAFSNMAHLCFQQSIGLIIRNLYGLYVIGVEGPGAMDYKCQCAWWLRQFVSMFRKLWPIRVHWL